MELGKQAAERWAAQAASWEEDIGSMRWGDVFGLAGVPAWSQQGHDFHSRAGNGCLPGWSCGLCHLGVGRGGGQRQAEWSWRAGAMKRPGGQAHGAPPLWTFSLVLFWHGLRERKKQHINQCGKTFFFYEVRDSAEFKKALNHLLRSDPVLKRIKTK